MQKSELIERVNLLHLERAVTFNKAAPADQLRLAKDPSFWRVPHCCAEYAWNGVCLECGARLFSPVLPAARFRSPLNERVC